MDDEAREAARAHLTQLRADLNRAHLPPPGRPRPPRDDRDPIPAGPPDEEDRASERPAHDPPGGDDLGSADVAYRMELAAHRDTLLARLADKDARISELEAEIDRLRSALAGVAEAIGRALHSPAPPA